MWAGSQPEATRSMLQSALHSAGLHNDHLVPPLPAANMLCTVMQQVAYLLCFAADLLRSSLMEQRGSCSAASQKCSMSRFLI